MKAILVIDMPKNCGKCKVIHLQGIGESICNPVDWSERPSWCPLKPLPQKIDISEDELYEKQYMCFEGGWNACIDEILGE